VLAASCSTAVMNPKLEEALKSFGVTEVSGGKPVM